MYFRALDFRLTDQNGGAANVAVIRDENGNETDESPSSVVGGLTASPVVLIHGVGNGRREGVEKLRDFARAAHAEGLHAPFLAVLWPGDSSDQGIPTGPYEQHARIVADALTTLFDTLPQGLLPHVVAHSFGSRIALEWARAWNRSLGRVVLMAAGVKSGALVSAEYAHAAARFERLATMHAAKDNVLTLAKLIVGDTLGLIGPQPPGVPSGLIDVDTGSFGNEKHKHYWPPWVHGGPLPAPNKFQLATLRFVVGVIRGDAAPVYDPEAVQPLVA